MAIQYINTGSSANAGNGDSLRSAFIKVNNNFAYLSTASFGGGTGNGYTGSRGLTGYTGSRGDQGSIGYTGSSSGNVNTGVQNRLAYYATTGTTLSSLSAIVYTPGTVSSFPSLQIGAPGISPLFSIVRNAYTSSTGGFVYSQHHSTPDAANFTYYRTRGTSTDPTNVQNGDEIADIVFAGYHDGIAVAALVTVAVDGEPSTAGNVPAKYQISTNDGAGHRDFGAELSSSSTWKINKLSHLSTTTSSIIVSTNLIPSTNNTYDLGSTSSQWRSLYVGTSTIYLGGVALGIANSQLTVNGAPIQTSSLVSVGNTAPVTSTTGTLWYDDVSGRTYIYYDDSWVDASPSAVGYTGSAGAGYTGSAGNQGPIGYTGSAGGGGSGIESTSTLVNGTWTVSLSIDGTLKSPLRRDDTHTATNFIVNYNPVTQELTTSLNYSTSFNTNTTVANAINATTATTAGRLGNLRVVAPPSSLSGTSTNAVGDIAFDSSYFYYCSGTFTSATNVILLSQLEEFTNPTATIHFTKGAVTPEIGWTLSASYSSWTITGVVDDGYPNNTWSVDISGFGNGFYSLATGTVFTMTDPTPNAIWQKTPWSAITSTGTVARATTATYASIMLTEPTPTSSTSTGVKGQIAVSSTGMYVCVATNSWLRFDGVTF